MTTAMNHNQRSLAAQNERSKEGRTYRDPASTDSVDYRIRGEPNHLYEDPDIDEDIVYRIVPGNLVTNKQLQTCADNFSSDYGVWSWRAHLVMGILAEYGKPIHTSREKLRARCLPKGVNNILVLAVTKDGRHIGHCFVSQWMYGDNRVWWITQLLVLKGHRNQRRATRMLQALAMHYDIGKSTRRDLTGIVTPSPYAICTLLRVFGRGVEVLPSKPDWENNRVRHTPLLSSACEPIVSAAPLSYIRDAKLSPGKLIANTRFFVDHAASEEAMKRIVYSMNQRVVGPWEWLFGCLEPGYEYVCILDYSHSQEYKMDPELRDKLCIPDAPQPEKHASTPSKRLFRAALGSSRPSEQTSSPIRYAEIDRYLLEVPQSCALDPKLSNRAHASLHGSMRKLIFEAKELIAKHMLVLPTIMGAKQIPSELRRVYQSANLDFPLPAQIQTWNDFTLYAHEVFEHDINVEARLLILQAIHFQELREDQERSQRERARTDLELGKAARLEEKTRPVEIRKQEHVDQPSVNAGSSFQGKEGKLPSQLKKKYGLTSITPPRRPLAPKPQGPSGAVEAIAKPPAFTPRPRAKSMLSSMSPFRRSKVPKSERSPPETKPRSFSMTKKAPSTTPVTPEQTPAKHRSNPIAQATSTPVSVAPKTPVSTTLGRPSQNEMHAATTPPATPPSSPPQPSPPHYMAPTVGSMQRYETRSPQLFYSDESDGCSRSNVFGRLSLKNGGKTLDRTQGMRG